MGGVWAEPGGRAEDARGTHSQSHVSPGMLVCEENRGEEGLD